MNLANIGNMSHRESRIKYIIHSLKKIVNALTIINTREEYMEYEHYYFHL